MSVSFFIVSYLSEEIKAQKHIAVIDFCVLIVFFETKLWISSVEAQK